MAQAAIKEAGIELPAAGTWEVDAAHSTVGFTARHLMVTKVRGRFSDFGAHVTIGETPQTSSVTATIQTASVDTGSEQRDQHLRGSDFFDVETYPEIRFESTSLEVAGGAEFKLHGNLTIKDVTRPVTLDGEYLGVAADPWGGTRIGFTASTEVEREDWGLNWNVALEAGGMLVSKKVTLELDIQAVYKGE